MTQENSTIYSKINDIVNGPMPSWALNFIAGTYAAEVFVELFWIIISNYGYISATSLIIAIVITAVMVPAARYFVRVI